MAVYFSFFVSFGFCAGLEFLTCAEPVDVTTTDIEHLLTQCKIKVIYLDQTLAALLLDKNKLLLSIVLVNLENTVLIGVKAYKATSL